MFKTLFLQIEETTVYSAQRYLLSTTRWHAGRLKPNSFWDMTKCLKPYFCKLKKQQCIRRILSTKRWQRYLLMTKCTTRWQRVVTQVDWTNSFWDMTKCLKPYFCKLKKQQCIAIRQVSATCKLSTTRWQRVDTQVDWTNSFWDMTKCVKTLFLQIEETTVLSTIRRSATCWAQRATLTRWHAGRLNQ